MNGIKLDLTRYPIPLKAYIGGQYIDSTGSERQVLRSSVNDEVVTTDLQWSNAKDVDLAVEAAAIGLTGWQAMSRASRRDALVKYGQLISQHTAQIAWLEAIVTGKDFQSVAFEGYFATETFIYYGQSIDKFHGQVVSSENDSLQYVLRQPFGVCAAICPYNGPIIVFAMKVAPALAAGNAIVLKASETNPLSSLFVASLAKEAGIPDGVINVLTGGIEPGMALASHMKIRKISFTGSVAVGKQIQSAAAHSNLKSVTLELGGKSPVIIFPDADLDKAAVQSGEQVLTINGQGCAFGTRMYVHESIADEMIARMKAIAETHAKTLGGDPNDPAVKSTPLFNHRQKKTVLEFLKAGKGEATLLTGGNPVGDKGCYIEPTIFVDPIPNAKIMREEIFGPVLTIVRFKDEDEVLQLANDTEYGLAAYVWTSDMRKALHFSNSLEAGTVCVNNMIPLSPQAPFGGWKQSGQGYENGISGMEDWTQTKTVSIKI